MSLREETKAADESAARSAGPSAGLSFRDGRARVHLRCSDPYLTAVAREMFPDYLDRGGPPPRALQGSEGRAEPASPEVFAGRVGPPDACEVSGPIGEARCLVDEDEAVSEIERRLAVALLRGRGESYHLHAAALGTPSGAILVLGESGAGKSTIALGWLLAGRPLLADDVVTVDECAVIEDFRRRVKVDVARAVAAGLDPQETVAWRADADECWIDPAMWGGWGRPQAPAALVRVRYQDGVGLTCAPVSAATALAWLVDGHVGTGLAPDRSFVRLTDIVERVPAFDLVHGDAAQAIGALERVTNLVPAP